MTQTPKLNRRDLLAGAAGGLAALDVATRPTAAFAQDAAAPKPLPPYAAFKAAEAMIVHSAETIEMKRGFGGMSVVTPSSMVYVRNNVPPPDAAILADRNAWSVSIAGVAKPVQLSVGDLKSLGVETVASVLQCSGNGRSFFENKPSGTKWTVGAAACIVWSGVPVRDVVAACGGVATGMAFMTGTGGETLTAGLDPKTLIVERSVPVKAAETAMLAWEMNGEPISLAHGGPLRLVIPGYHGVNNIKYIKSLAFTAAETDAKIQKSSYRLHPVDVKGAPDQPSMWEMPVKSWITAPLATAKPGRVLVTGVAFGGINEVKSVELSIDGGTTWTKAAFTGPNLGRYAWRPFAVPLDLKPGTYRLVSRATDDAGITQPADFPANGSGYGHNGWRAHGVDVTVA